MINNPGSIKSIEEAAKALIDIFNNLGVEDLRAGGILQEAPIVDEMDSGQIKIVEITDVPFLYYKTLSGDLYRIAMTLA